jgi:hypothetical protein
MFLRGSALSNSLALLRLLSELSFSATPAKTKKHVSVRSNNNVGNPHSTWTESHRNPRGISWGNALPVRQIPVSLGSLGAEVGQVAGKEKVVLGCDGEGVAHESASVDKQGSSHSTGDTAQKKGVSRGLLVALSG